MQVKLMNYANPHNCVISATKLIHEKEKSKGQNTFTLKKGS